MRLVSYRSGSAIRVAGVRNGEWIDLNRADPELPSEIIPLLSLGDVGLKRAGDAIARGDALDPTGCHLVAPVPNPQKVICIGLNYADHAAESGAAVPAEPVVFNKFPTALRGHMEPIELPSISSKVDYEAELVVVIGRGGRNIAREAAMEHVVGFCCGHDVSARDWQLESPGGQWLMGKTFDSFAPVGPELVTRDEVSDPSQLDISLRLNGETMQHSNTRQLIFDIPQLIAHLSKVCTLSPGDLLFTGTPPGVGMARKPPIFLQDGDMVEIEIERIGTLRNPVQGLESRV
jgi:2-keto-4-pentenoate hydratase/2-oxohepta-3-ene-1,7-dioic acid hydratase in catechol pathway